MAEAWSWKNIEIKENGGWVECGAYVNQNNTWVYHTPYVAGDNTNTLYHLEVGRFTSTSSIKGYDPYVNPPWYDPGDLTPPNMWRFNIWRMNKTSSRVLIRVTGGQIGDPESIELTFPDDGTKYIMTQSDTENWINTEQSFIDRFDNFTDLYFYLNDGDTSLPPLVGDYHLRVGTIDDKGQYSNYRGYDPYNPEWYDPGDLTPDTMFGFSVWRMHAHRDDKVVIKLTSGQIGDPEAVTVSFANGNSYPFTQNSSEDWHSYDEEFIDLFFNNDDLHFDINSEGGPVDPPVGDYDYVMNVGEYSSGSKIRGYDGYSSPYYGEITPNEFDGEFIRRFRTGSSGNLTILYMAGLVPQSSVTMELSTGETFIIPESSTQSEYRSYDEALWLLFQENSTLEFNLT